MITSPTLQGRRVGLRPLVAEDFPAWAAVRQNNEEWLTPWEPRPVVGRPDVTNDQRAFSARCGARAREAQLGTGYGFGVFLDDHLIGEVNLSSIRRGALQSGDIGYWIDRDHAGQGYMPESVVTVLAFAFEDLALHRVEIDIIPRNQRSRRVVEKLDLRMEGLAERLVEINGAWEDHIRYAITLEEWARRGSQLRKDWLS
ncbi:MAG TPA: GNAT family protein [Acidimicrobiales bacterium]|nr:GNAT family protein [Acidimicrobiales bacterium]